MIRLFKVGMARAAEEAVAEVLRSGYIGQGPKVDEFEAALQKTWGLDQKPLTLNSATSALDLALTLVGVGPGDKVLTTPQTCTATNSPIVTRGATPVWCDVDTEGLIAPASVERNFRRHPDAKAVIAVDWAGTPADYKRIRKAAPGVPVVQDAAHRFGGPAYGDYVVWSFQAIKFLTTGDGGALLTPAAQYERAKLLRWYGLDRESSASFRCAQNITEVGFKYHMNDIAASIGLANLPAARQNLRVQYDNARYLGERLGIEVHPESHYWFFPVTVDMRDEFIAYLADEGIEASQVHARNDKHDGFHFPNGKLPGVDWFDSHQAALPCGWWLTRDELDHVADTVIAWDNAMSELRHLVNLKGNTPS